MIFFLSRAIAGKRAGDLAIGESVWLIENDKLTEYFVVQQGNPDSSTYTDANADGTWLMMRDVSDYGEVSYIDARTACKDGTYLARFPADVQAAIREVTLPRYIDGDTTITSKIHIPSGRELAPSISTYTAGSVLDYFVSGRDSDRVAYLDGAAEAYWTFDRYAVYNSVLGTDMPMARSVSSNGSFSTDTVTTANLKYIRPLLILDPDTRFDSTNNFIG